jgi:hypothetical protein
MPSASARRPGASNSTARSAPQTPSTGSPTTEAIRTRSDRIDPEALVIYPAGPLDLNRLGRELCGRFIDAARSYSGVM